ncbi:DUF362 domain-containing protein [Pleomorphochaeta sp. DL1XJH-081]|jgi:uncharacterized protein (DUF362 family)/NAD-dependent dihydropyrimidine dehydrogenase PreA subunit|uniref:DUF362 domain-containing protein n=1 Tax=Pleomorphochaeta sp. DL1XJH-081 TaxID=3409690 RepID=UPI003BB68978
MKKYPIVAISRCGTYHDDEIDAVLEKLCSMADFPDILNKRVLLKPNILSDAAPEKAITTRPEILAALIRLCYRRGADQVLVGDSPGIHGPNFIPKTSMIGEVCEKEGAQWCEFAKEPRMHRIPGTLGHKLPLPKIMDDVDVIISVAKLKTHQLMYATGSVKNLFGMVPGLHKSACHMRYPTRESFARMLAGLYSVIKPHYAIMDAIVSMEGPGPAGGIPRHTGLLLASNDPTALDVAQAIIMGYQPFSLPLIRELHDKKLSQWNKLEDIAYPLLNPEKLVIADFKRIKQEKRTRLLMALFGPLVSRFIQLKHQQKEPKPLFDNDLCIRCGRCVKICPGKALTLDKDRGIVADYSACIRCYCCHEVCPADAITIEKRNGSGSWISRQS